MTLFIADGDKTPLIAMNKRTLGSLSNAEAKELAIIANATNLSEEPDKMEEVAQIAADWFQCYLLRATGKNKFHNRYAITTRQKFCPSCGISMHFR
jgi:formate dehydrogenase maturation protein FdhE